MADDEFKRFLVEVDQTISELVNDLRSAAENEENETLQRAWHAHADKGELMASKFGDMVIKRKFGI